VLEPVKLRVQIGCCVCDVLLEELQQFWWENGGVGGGVAHVGQVREEKPRAETTCNARGTN
jgi:hypothetical protein